MNDTKIYEVRSTNYEVQTALLNADIIQVNY